MIKRLLVTLPLLASPAWAALPDIPGSGIDATFLPEPDKDNDGYRSDGAAGKIGLAYKDCNDNDRNVFPGEYYPCNCGTGANTGTRLCQTDGTYGACTCTATTPLCEAHATTHCYYVDFDDGDDAHPGTYAEPFKTLAKVTGGYACTGQPGSPVELIPDDIVYIINDGTYSTEIQCDAAHGLFVVNASGTAGHPITLKRYPGGTATIVGTADTDGISLGTTNVRGYWKFKDLDVSMGTSASTYRVPFFLTGGYTDVEIQRCYVHDSAGNGNDNFSCLSANHGNTFHAHHNRIHDCKWASGNITNVSGIMILDDPGGTEGEDHWIHNNVVDYTTWDEAANGQCVRNKHGLDTVAEAGANGTQVNDNYCINTYNALSWNGAGLRARRNLYVVDDSSTTYQEKAFLDACQDTGRIEDAIIEYNTMSKGSRWIDWRHCDDTFTNAEKMTIRYNVAVAQSKAYDGDVGFWGIQRYGSAAELTAFEGISALVADYNCYSGNQTLYYAYFNADGGGRYSLADLFTNQGYEEHSYEENPTFDSKFRATTDHCKNWGWLLTSEEPAAGTGKMLIGTSD